jgi:hypothetical protein
MVWTRFIWLRKDISGSFCQHSNKLSGYIKLWECLEELNNFKLLKKDSAKWIMVVRNLRHGEEGE